MGPPEPWKDPASSGVLLGRIVQGALAGHGHLFSPEETAVYVAFLALPPPERHLAARLLWRAGACFRPDRENDADRSLLPVLESAGFLEEEHAEEARWDALRVGELRTRCRDRGLPSGTPRPSLVNALKATAADPGVVVFRVAHRSLFRRAERLFFRNAHPSRLLPVLDALGRRRPPSYVVTPTAPLFENRSEMLLFEDILERLDGEPTLDTVLAAWDEAGTRRGLVLPALRVHAQALEKAGQPAQAADLYRRIVQDDDASGTLSADVVHRFALCLEATGRVGEAVALLRNVRDRADPARRLALDRTGRRLAKKASIPWVPLPPLRVPATRVLWLPEAEPAGARPRFRVHGGEHVVEQAVIARLSELGRRAIHGENAPWTTFFALLFRDLYFLPVPGMLPVAGLSGPLDLGTADFARNRESAVHTRLQEIAAGAAPALVRERFGAFEGEALAGAAWAVATGEELASVAESLGGPALAAILGRLATEGWVAARGLPDLLILPGPAVRWDGAIPATLPSGFLLAELKTPSDQVRDDQAAWFDHLLRAGVTVEVWRVRAA